jgi:hypothetical protein
MIVKNCTKSAVVLAIFGAGIKVAHISNQSDPLGLLTVLIPLTFVFLCFLYFVLLWTPCLLIGILFRPKSTSEAEIKRVWTFFIGSLFPFFIGGVVFLKQLGYFP